MLLKLPYSTEAVTKFRNFSAECATKRKMRGSTERDLFHYLVRTGNFNLLSLIT